MITNETRAKLIGSRSFHQERDGYGEVVDTRPLPYDTDANAVAELRAFVRARGKEFDFVFAVWREVVGYIPMDPTEGDELDLLDATPAQPLHL